MDNFSGKRLQVLAAAASAIILAGSFFAFGGPLLTNGVPQAYSQEEYASLASAPSIKVTGEASAMLQPDQASMVVIIQTQPGDLADVVEEQEDKISQVTDAVRGADAGATITIGQQNINPYYTSGVTPSNDVTFNVYASVAVHTDIDHLSDLVNALAEEGFGFESVYIDPVYYASIMQQADGSIVSDTANDAEDQDGELKPIAIGVSLNTKPDVLTNAIAEYEQKYRALLDILDQVGISEDQVQQSNFNIYPMYYGPSQNNGYQAYTQVIVKTDPRNIEAITEAVRDADSYVENVFLSVSDAAIEEVRKGLTQAAFDNARSRAQEMADSLGLEIMGVKSIDASANEPRAPYGETYVYKGLYLRPPYYYPQPVGEATAAVTVKFELGSGAEEQQQ